MWVGTEGFRQKAGAPTMGALGVVSMEEVIISGSAIISLMTSREDPMEGQTLISITKAGELST